MASETERKEELKELKAIKNLLIIQLIKNGASSEEIDLATGMGAGNVRAKFSKVKLNPGVKQRGKSQE